jgi:hypothetical protein
LQYFLLLPGAFMERRLALVAKKTKRAGDMETVKFEVGQEFGLVANEKKKKNKKS